MDIKKILSDAFHGVLADWLGRGLLAAMTLGLPYWAWATEHWSWPLIIGFGIVLFAAGLSIYRNIFGSENAAGKTPTHIKYQFNAGSNLPLILEETNIRTSYALWTEFRPLTLQGTQLTPLPAIKQWSIFLIFEKPIAIKQFRIDGGGATLPHHEVKQSSDRHALIHFSGDLSGIVIDIQPVVWQAFIAAPKMSAFSWLLWRNSNSLT